MKSAAAAVAAPSFGPAIVTLFGIDVPIVALVMSCAGLILARYIAPPPLRRLSRSQEWALTLLLLIVLFLMVTGQFPGFGGKPLSAGTAVIWGVGLGLSGLLAVEIFGERVINGLRAVLGSKNSDQQ